jgi:hypothetical protein
MEEIRRLAPSPGFNVFLTFAKLMPFAGKNNPAEKNVASPRDLNRCI